MPPRCRQERNRIPSDHLVNFTRYVAPPEPPARKDVTDEAPPSRPMQRNLRCYIADIGLPFSKLSISRPNLTVEWNLVELVDLLVDEDTPVTCPICLDESLLAPRVARCGHAFCWMCILKYLNFDKTLGKRPCPLCLQSIYRSDLKPVRFQIKKKPIVLSFALLMQEEDAYTALLHPDICELLCGKRKMRPDNQIPSSDSPDIQFWDVAFTDHENLRDLLKRDYLEVEKIALDALDVDIPTYEAAQQALCHLSENGIGIPTDEKLLCSDGLENLKDSIRQLSNVADSYVYEKSDVVNKNLESAGLTKHYCFYQSVDGSKVLLHPQLVKCLWHCCGRNVNNLPLFLVNLPVLSLEEIVVSKEMRRRYNWLNHFRMGCKIYLAHVPLEGYISPDDLREFMRERQIKLDMKLSKMLQVQEEV
ncbi:ring finger domain containing protein [Babesia ovis]|uniref:Ring finger domain containing protein n=1 Tax=Babesia ovis TaxID=5869 RepID=A0A9W5T9X8_BABOV|nr:ring finger domain containing protein [Babesia ovis]